MSNHFIAGVSAVLFCASLAFCQDPTGIFGGKISDPSGALVPKATVIVTNLSTGFSAAQTSSSAGDFRFSFLPVGTYDLRVVMKGFSTFETTGISLDVNRVVNLPVTLALAGTKQTEEVSAKAASVDDSSALGNVISAHDAVDLPLNGRNLTQLGLLQPGVAPLTFGLLQAGGIARANQAYAVNVSLLSPITTCWMGSAMSTA